MLPRKALPAKNEVDHFPLNPTVQFPSSHADPTLEQVEEDRRLLKPSSGSTPLTERKVGAYFVRLLRREETESALELYRVAGEPVPSPRQWDWRFFSRNPELSYVPAAFNREGQLVALYPATVRPAWVDGLDLMSYQACRTLIHPDFRGGGRLYLALLRFCFQRNDSIGIHFGFGGGAGKAALKVGAWALDNREMCTLQTYERRLSWRLALQRRFGRGGGSFAAFFDAFGNRDLLFRDGQIQVETVHQSGPMFDELWRRKRHHYRVLLRRDARELKWRYFDCPVATTVLVAKRRGELEGYAAIRHRQDDMGKAQLSCVIDMFSGQDPAVEMALLRAAGAEGRHMGTDFLQFAPVPGSVAETMVKQGPWRPAKRPLESVVVGHTSDHSAEVGLSEVVSVAVEGKHWYYCQGDSDFYD
ncbi:MAG: hypothetical protein DWQ01_21530 [Planctomycetota bacterium]|nr:MAG: hypothetical protein DWQ01_21530 [Planctomycetota bacterium]